ncbi:hypothetical protein D9M69_612400 [compost metagenome]
MQQDRFLQPHQARQRPATTYEDLLGDELFSLPFRSLFTFLRLLRTNSIGIIAIKAGHDCSLRQRKNIVFLRKLNADLNELARYQARLIVLNLCTDRNQAA